MYALIILHFVRSIITITAVTMYAVSCTRWEFGIQLYPHLSFNRICSRAYSLGRCA